MLVEIKSNNSSASKPKKQIAVVGIDANTVIYTVPEGRVFNGFLSSDGTSHHYINGIRVFQGDAADGQATSPVTLVAGSSWAGSSTNTLLYGVEEDA